MPINLAGTVILAGGESSRMGTPKALLTLPNDETLLDFHIKHAKMLGVPVMIADNGKGFSQRSDVVIIQDYLSNENNGKGAGALSAIAGAMDYLVYKTNYLLVVSCDSLLGAEIVFEQLKSLETTADIIYLKNEKDYPLLGLYHLSLLPKLKEYLEHGNRAVMKFLSGQQVKTLELPKEWVTLANVNTVDEFTLALNKMIE